MQHDRSPITQQTAPFPQDDDDAVGSEPLALIAVLVMLGILALVFLVWAMV